MYISASVKISLQLFKLMVSDSGFLGARVLYQSFCFHCLICFQLAWVSGVSKSKTLSQPLFALCPNKNILAKSMVYWQWPCCQIPRALCLVLGFFAVLISKLFPILVLDLFPHKFSLSSAFLVVSGMIISEVDLTITVRWAYIDCFLGEMVTKQPLIRSMRTVKRETLKLISGWVSRSNDPQMVRFVYFFFWSPSQFHHVYMCFCLIKR